MLDGSVTTVIRKVDMDGLDIYTVFKAMEVEAGVPQDDTPVVVEQEQANLDDEYQFVLEFWLN